MKNITVEYLLLFKHNGSFCSDVNSFNSLLKSNSDISIENDTLNFKSLKIKYFVICNNVKDKDERYFKVSLTIAKENEIEIFQELLKIFREIIHKGGGTFNMLWDDISRYYSTKAYPEINRIENMLRKLINLFMITNIGNNWIKEAVPEDIKINAKKVDNKFELNFLHQTDFIQLADFLFKAYSKKDINVLYKNLKEVKDNSELDLEILQEYIPKSNWERYFKDFVNCEDQQLDKMWRKLYEYRCLIAHNNGITKSDYIEITKNINELSELLEKAIQHVDSISIPEDDQIILLQNALENQNELYARFFSEWVGIVEEFKNLYKININSDNESTDLTTQVNELVEQKYIKKQSAEKFEKIKSFRTRLLRDTNSLSQTEIDENIYKATDLYLDAIVFGL